MLWNNNNNKIYVFSLTENLYFLLFFVVVILVCFLTTHILRSQNRIPQTRPLHMCGSGESVVV